ncbi:hypothetical protein ABW19_dt0207619 [Dactylella cylindrospora]|nr:hypothetical protein ABW19_dt0207619 [Dactylella cylindrospora]
MEASKLEIYIALSLLPYLDATDICRARGVNKHWNELFSSPDLLRAALRIHGSASREHQILTRVEGANGSSADSKIQLDYKSLFRNFSIRTNNLRNGTPTQEMRIQIRRAASTPNFVYAIADDVLVYLSPEVGGLSVIFWNHDTSEYSNMRVELGTNNQTIEPSAWSVRKLRVFEDILIVEHTKEVKLPNATGSSFWSIIQTFRLTSPFAKPREEGEKKPEGSYEQLSVFTTFKFRYVNYTDSIISDHSQTHYAALSGRSNSLGAGVFVWDIYTGKLVFKHEQQPLGSRNMAQSPVTVSDKVIMVENSHVLLVKPDSRNPFKWRKIPEDPIGFKVYILTFAVNAGEENEEGVISPQEGDFTESYVTRDKDDEMMQSYHDYIQWRVIRQRAPKLHHNDSPTLKTYLNLWGRTRVTRMRKQTMEEDDEEWSRHPIERTEIHQYELTTSLPEGELDIRAIYTAVNDQLPEGYPDPDASIPKPSMSEISFSSDSPFFLNSNGTDALSFDMVWTGGSTECLGTRLMTFYFGIRSFQLTETSSVKLKKGGPLRYHLDYSSYLKVPGKSGVVREIPSIQRNVLAMAQSHRGMVVPIDVYGDERMSIYTEPRKENNIADLVMCVWGSEKLKPLE